MRLLVTCDPIIPVPPTGYGGIERIAELYDDYFTLSGVCRQIHKRVEQLADPRIFRALMEARPYAPGTVPVPIPEGL